MKNVDYKDNRGRWYRVRLPDDATMDQVNIGIPVGPPDVVDALALPEPYATNLHNQLFMRNLFSANDVRKNAAALQGAIMAAMSADVSSLYQAYVDLETETKLT